jgi:hypothetical protein
MAYLIGNTTVISDVPALGSVDGNALNLSNNPNLTAGGASATFKTSTANAAVVGSTYAIVISTGGGGGGGTFSNLGAGSAGLTSMSFHDVSGGGNATYTVGAAGTGGFQAPFSNNNILGFAGGNSDFTYAGTEYGNPLAGGGTRGSSGGNQTTNSTIHQAGGYNLANGGTTGFFPGYGDAGPSGSYNANGTPGTAGMVFMLGF